MGSPLAVVAAIQALATALGAEAGRTRLGRTGLIDGLNRVQFGKCSPVSLASGTI